MALIQRRMQEFNLWDESRFHTFSMRQRFQLGPFECVVRPVPALSMHTSCILVHLLRWL